MRNLDKITMKLWEHGPRKSSTTGINWYQTAKAIQDELDRVYLKELQNRIEALSGSGEHDQPWFEGEGDG